MSDQPFTTYNTQPFNLKRDPSEWDDVAARARLFASTFPQLAQDPNALWGVASAPIPPIMSATNAYALAGAQGVSAQVEQIMGWSESQQRAHWAQISDQQKAKYQQMGYQPPDEPGGDVWGAGVLKPLGPIVETIYTGGYKAAAGVIKPTLRGLDELSSLPFEAVGEVRTGEPWQQVLAGVVAVGAVYYMMKTGGGPGQGYLGQLASKPLLGALEEGAGGLTYARALASTGGAGISLAASTGATAAWATKALTDTVMGNRETWIEPIGWLDHRHASERNFVHGALESAKAKLGTENGMILDFAKQIALEADDPVGAVLTEFGGEAYPAEHNLQVRQGIMLEALERLVSAQHLPGSASYQAAYLAGEALIKDERFTDAVETLVAGKFSVGRDLMRVLSIPFGRDIDADKGFGKVLSGSVDAASWLLVDPIIGAAKFGHAQRIMRRALMLDAGTLMQRLETMVQKPGIRAGFRFMADHLNEAETSKTALARLYRAMPDTMELTESMDSWRRRVELREVTRGTTAGSFWDEDRVAQFFTDSGGLSQMLAGKAGSYRYGYLQMPYLNPVFGEKAALMKQTFWEAIENLDDIKLGIRTKTFLGPAYEAAEKMGILPTDPNRLWGSATALVEHGTDEAGKELPRLVRLLGTPASLAKTMLTRTPSAGYLSLAGRVEDPANFVREVRSLTELMRAVGAPSMVRQEWMDLILRAPDIGARRRAVNYMYDTMFKAVDLRSGQAGEEFAEKFLNHNDQLYSLGRREAVTVSETSELLATPNLREMRKAIVQEHLFQKVLGVSDANKIDATMNKVWKPAVLLRMGFITRAVGDEMLGWIAREGAAGYVGARMAKFYGSGEALPGHVRWIESTASALNNRRAQLSRFAFAPWHDAEELADLAEAGDHALRMTLLNKYGDWFRNFTENGTWLGRINLPGYQLEGWAKREGTFRSMLFNGLDEHTLAKGKAFYADPKVKSAIMKEVTAAHMNGTTAEMRYRNQYFESPIESALYGEPTHHLAASGRGAKTQVADRDNPYYLTHVFRGQGQTYQIDDPIREAFVNLEIASPHPKVRSVIASALPGVDRADIANFTDEFKTAMKTLSGNMEQLSATEKILLSNTLLDSDGIPTAFEKMAEDAGRFTEAERELFSELAEAFQSADMHRSEVIDALLVHGLLPEWTDSLKGVFSIAGREDQLLARSYLTALMNRSGKGLPLDFARMSLEEKTRRMQDAWVSWYGAHPDWRRKVDGLSAMTQTSITERPLAYNPGRGEQMGYLPLIPSNMIEGHLMALDTPTYKPQGMFAEITRGDLGTPVMVNGQLHYPVIGMVTTNPVHARQLSEDIFGAAGYDVSGRYRPGQITAEVVLPDDVGGGRTASTPWLANRDPIAQTVLGEGVMRITDPSAAFIHVPDPVNGVVLLPNPQGGWTARNGASTEEALREHAEVTVQAYLEKFHTSTPELRDPENFAKAEPKTEPVDPDMTPVDDAPRMVEGEEPVAPPPLRAHLDPTSGRYDLSIDPDGIRADVEAGFPFLRGEATVEVTNPVRPDYPDQMSAKGPVLRWQGDPTDAHFVTRGMLPESAGERPQEYLQAVAMGYVTDPVDPEWPAQAMAETRRMLKWTDKWDDGDWEALARSLPGGRQRADDIKLFLESPDLSQEYRLADIRREVVNVLSGVLGQEAARRAARLQGPKFREWVDAQWSRATNRWEAGAAIPTDPVAKANWEVRRDLQLKANQGDLTVKASDWDADYSATVRSFEDMVRRSSSIHPEAINFVILADDVHATRRLLSRLEGDMNASSIYKRLQVIGPESHRPAYLDLMAPPYRPETMARFEWQPARDLSVGGQAGIIGGEPSIMVNLKGAESFTRQQKMAEAAGVGLNEWYASGGKLTEFMAQHGTTPERLAELGGSIPEKWMHTYHHETGHNLFGHVGAPYNSGMERAVNRYADHTLGLPVGHATWGVAGVHPHPESIMLGAWLKGRPDSEAILAYFAENPGRYQSFLQNWTQANLDDSLTNLSDVAFNFDPMLEQTGYRPPDLDIDEGTTRMMFESVAPFTAEHLHEGMHHTSMGSVSVVSNTMDRRLFPGFALERIPVLAEPPPTGLGRIAEVGFGKVIGPWIDNLIREPMAFHHYSRAMRDAESAQKYLLDPHYFATGHGVGRTASWAHTGAVNQETWGAEEQRLAGILSQEMGLQAGGVPTPFVQGGMPIVGDAVVDKALDISLGRPWLQNDITPEPWLAANRDKVLEALGDDPLYQPLRNIVSSIEVDSTAAEKLALRPRGLMYDLVERKVTGLDTEKLREAWPTIRPAVGRLSGERMGMSFTDRFNVQDFVHAARSKDRSIALVDEEIRIVEASKAQAVKRSSEAGIATADKDLAGLTELKRVLEGTGALSDEDGIDAMLHWWGEVGRKRLRGRDLWSLTPEQGADVLKDVNKKTPFGPMTLGELQTIEGAYKSKATVQAHLHDLAISRAINDTIPYVDRDNVRTLFSDNVRNLIPFWAAEDQFMRRWARIAQHTPEFIRKAQLTYMGLKHVGTIQTDEFGNDYFVYPGTTALVEVMGKLPFLDTMAPLTTALTGQVRYSLPGLDRFGVPQVSPIISVPMTQLSHIVPEIKPFARTIAGDRAATMSVLEQLVPTQIVRFGTALFMDPLHAERMAGSLFTAAQVLQANGHGLPDSADPTAVEAYKHRLANHARTIYFAKAIFGFFAPASPSDQIVGSDTPGQTGSWRSFSSLTGMGSPNVLLNDEWQNLIFNLGIEEGTTEFLALYPDAVPDDLFDRNIAYRVSRTETLGKAPIASNDETYEFYRSNEQWIRDNPLAGAWLMPPASRKKVSNSESQRVRMEQMAVGLRGRKGIDEFIGELMSSVAGNIYYEQKRMYDDQYAVLTDQDKVKALKARQAVWETAFKNANPIFKEQLETGEGRTRRQAVIGALRTAMADPATPDARHRTLMFEMVKSYDVFKGAMAQLNMVQTEKARQMKSAIKAWFKDFGDKVALRDPDVARFWTTIIVPEADLD